MNNDNISKRPTSVAGMVEALKLMGSDEGIEKGLAFQPKKTDVIISPYPKSGTTWLQQMVHTMRTRGDMDFREISDVVPWIEVAHDLGINVNDSQQGTPRVYKSHLNWEQVPKGGKYIYAIRNPKDVVISLYHFFEGWFFETGAISVKEFTVEFFMERDQNQIYWHHIASWWQQRLNPEVLMLCFEEMKADLGQTVRAVAAFIGIELDEELYELTLRNSSYVHMKAHESQFNDVLMRELSEKNSGLPPGGNASKVRAGQINAHKQELPREVRAMFDTIWQAEIDKRFGLKTYEEMRKALERRK